MTWLKLFNGERSYLTTNCFNGEQSYSTPSIMVNNRTSYFNGKQNYTHQVRTLSLICPSPRIPKHMY